MFGAQAWLLVAIDAMGIAVGIVAVVDLLRDRDADPRGRMVLGLLALIVPIVGVPLWGLYRGHWQRVVAACWMGFAALALVNIGVLIPLSRR